MPIDIRALLLEAQFQTFLRLVPADHKIKSFNNIYTPHTSLFECLYQPGKRNQVNCVCDLMGRLVKESDLPGSYSLYQLTIV